MMLKLMLTTVALTLVGACSKAPEQTPKLYTSDDLLGAQTDGFTRALKCQWDDGETTDGTIYSVARVSKLVNESWDVKFRIVAKHADGSIVSYPLDPGWGGDEDYSDYQVAGAPEDFPISAASIQVNFEWASLVDLDGFSAYDCREEILPKVDQHTPEQVQKAVRSGTVNLRHPACQPNQVRLGDSCGQMRQLPRAALIDVIRMKREHDLEPLTGNLTTRLYTFDQDVFDPEENAWGMDGMQLLTELGLAPEIVATNPIIANDGEGIAGLPDHQFASNPERNSRIKAVVDGMVEGQFWVSYSLKHAILVNADHGFEVEYHAYIVAGKLLYFKLVKGF